MFRWAFMVILNPIYHSVMFEALNFVMDIWQKEYLLSRVVFNIFYAHHHMYVLLLYNFNIFEAHMLALSFSIPLFHIAHVVCFHVFENFDHFCWTVLSYSGTRYSCWLHFYSGCTLKIVQSWFRFLLLLLLSLSYVTFTFVLYKRINYFEIEFKLNIFTLNFMQDITTLHVLTSTVIYLNRRRC